MGMMTRRNVKARVASAAPAVVEEKVEKPTEVYLNYKVKSSGLSKTEINRMSTAELQELAKGFGVKDAEEMSGNQIKKLLNGAMED
jgi:hypothetical protein